MDTSAQLRMPYRVILVDDEPAARSSMAVLLAERPEWQVVASCSDGQIALEAIEEHQPDLVFLDIQMPELDGFGVVRALTGQASLPLFVFVTAYEQYALRAFEANALDYLLKPYDDDRFYRSLDKAQQMLQSAQASTQASQLAQLIQHLGLTPYAKPNAYLKKLVTKQQGKMWLIPVEDILFIESESNFVKVHTGSGMKIANYTCKQLEDLLDPKQFIRIHKSYMVNVAQVEAIEPHFHGDYVVYLRNGASVKLSRHYKDKLDLILNQY